MHRELINAINDILQSCFQNIFIIYSVLGAKRFHLASECYISMNLGELPFHPTLKHDVSYDNR